MIRDILNLRSGENVVYEYLSENVMNVVGENAYSDADHSGGSFVSFPTGPTFKVGRVSSFRGLEKEISRIRRIDHRNGLFTFQMELNDGDIYPLTVVADRYSGVYSGGKYTAWNCYPFRIPDGPFSSDIPCSSFWGSEMLSSNVRFVGGSTPQKAIEDLERRLSGQSMDFEVDYSVEDYYD